VTNYFLFLKLVSNREFSCNKFTIFRLLGDQDYGINLEGKNMHFMYKQKVFEYSSVVRFQHLTSLYL